MAEPSFNARTSPLESTEATSAFKDFQVRTASSASAGSTVALRVSFSPIIISAVSLSSLTSSTAVGLTITLHVAEASPALTVTTVSPAATPVTSPSLLTFATALSADDHSKSTFADDGVMVGVSCSVCPLLKFSTDLFNDILTSSISVSLHPDRKARIARNAEKNKPALFIFHKMNL